MRQTDFDVPRGTQRHARVNLRDEVQLLGRNLIGYGRRRSLHLQRLLGQLSRLLFLYTLVLALFPLDLVEFHPFEEAEGAVGISELNPGLVLLLDERIVVLEYDVVQMFRVSFDELIVVHQIYDVTCVHTTLTVHFGKLFLLFVSFLCCSVAIPLLDCLIHVIFQSLRVAVL